jgi:hypothetical protein
MAGPNLLGRRADLEVTGQRIDSHFSVPETDDFLKGKNLENVEIKSLFLIVYEKLVKGPSKQKRRLSERLFCFFLLELLGDRCLPQMRMGMMM